MLRQFRLTGGYDLQKMKLINTLNVTKKTFSTLNNQSRKERKHSKFHRFFTVLRINYALNQRLKIIENIRLLQY